MGTSCNLNNLVCGQEYSVTVEAMHTGCPGPASAPVTLTTGVYWLNLTVLILTQPKCVKEICTVNKEKDASDTDPDVNL